jgi:hypothetical protein
MIKRICLLILLAIVFFLFLRVYVDGQFVDFDCVNFKTQTAAKEIYDRFPYDKYGLDIDRDGRPCEILPK